MLGLAGTGLQCCSLPLTRLDNLAIPLPPVPLPIVVSELEVLLTGIGVRPSVAADLLSDRIILTCLHMTAGIPGYVALLWKVMMRYWGERDPRTVR